MAHQNMREIRKQREMQRQERGEAMKLSDAGLLNPRVLIEMFTFTAELLTIIGGAVVV